MRRQLTVAGWMLAAYLAIFISAMSVGYVTGDPERYAVVIRDKYIAHHGLVLLHALFANLALVLGPFQFWTALRTRLPGVHRSLGALYLVAVLVAAISGFELGLAAFGGPIAITNFTTLAIAWLVTAAMAVLSLMRRDFRAHRRWMLRNYALTFSAVTLRFYIYWLEWYGIPYGVIYTLATWAAWVPNIFIIELWTRHKEAAVNEA